MYDESGKMYDDNTEKPYSPFSFVKFVSSCEVLVDTVSQSRLSLVSIAGFSVSQIMHFTATHCVADATDAPHVFATTLFDVLGRMSYDMIDPMVQIEVMRGSHETIVMWVPNNQDMTVTLRNSWGKVKDASRDAWVRGACDKGECRAGTSRI